MQNDTSAASTTAHTPGAMLVELLLIFLPSMKAMSFSFAP
jgi:hypothetical protein